jgi:prophage DNA circulation protein
MALIDINVHHYIHFKGDEIMAKLDKMAATQTELKELIMSNQAEVADALRQTLAAQAKTAQEITVLQGTVTTLQDTVTQLEEAVANAGNIPQDIVDLVAQVKAGAVAIDEQIPDVPSVESPAA